MRLHKALKLRKKLAGEIGKLKSQIIEKNSYMEGSLDVNKFNVNTLYATLQKKIDDLVGLKFAINEANREIQSKIYLLSEYKGLISFWENVPTTEGDRVLSRIGDGSVIKYHAQVDEIERDNIISDYQKKVDALQEEIDVFNYTTDIPWGDEDDVQEPNTVK